jgi:4-alpha-glucanotransferase
MRFERQSGVFLHPTSLPSPHGIGDLGAGAREFIDFLAQADQSLWQFCPLGPTSGAHGNSSYQSYSAFAGSPLLIDLRGLVEDGYLTEAEAEPPADAFSPHEARYARVAEFKLDRLRSAYDRFEETASEADRQAFESFCEREAGWLDDYALFRAVKDEFGGRLWTEWPAEIRDREPSAMERYREQLSEEVSFRQFLQWQFDAQWQAVAEYAAEHGITLVGDLPIYVALDSADVWAVPEIFLLDEQNQPTDVAGVPPNTGDDGQRWGNPVYDWDRLRETGYRWWLDRFERLFNQVDIARIDHFKGFDEFWAIPIEAEDPAAGQWLDGPGADFFETVEAELGDAPFFVEDLGFLDESIASLKDGFDFPGMVVPQYADWCEPGHIYQPMNYPEDVVAYTSTHDTDTVVGYYRKLSDRQRNCLQHNLGTNGTEINWEMIEAVWDSNAVVAVTTVQDLLGLGSEARFNQPGSATGNWRWRVTEEGFDPDVAERLRLVTDRTIR